MDEKSEELSREAREAAGQEYAVGNVVRYIGKDDEKRRGHLFRVARMSKKPGAKIQLGSIAGEPDTGGRAWWVSKSDVELVSASASSTLGTFTSDELNAEPHDPHEHEPKPLKAPRKAKAPAPAPTHEEVEERPAERATAPQGHVFVVSVQSHDDAVIWTAEVYGTSDAAEQRCADLDELFGALGIDMDVAWNRVRVR